MAAYQALRNAKGSRKGTWLPQFTNAWARFASQDIEYPRRQLRAAAKVAVNSGEAPWPAVFHLHCICMRVCNANGWKRAYESESESESDSESTKEEERTRRRKLRRKEESSWRYG